MYITVIPWATVLPLRTITVMVGIISGYWQQAKHSYHMAAWVTQHLDFAS